MQKHRVIVDRLDDQALADQLHQHAGKIGLDEAVRSARSVFIKPNLTYPTYKPGVTTRVEFVEALVVALRRIKPSLRILVGDGEGGYNSFNMSDAMRVMGFYDLEVKYPGVKVVNLSALPRTEVSFHTPKGDVPISVPSIFLEEVDFSISCPLPKIHDMTKLTLSYKNLWGCLPDTMRLQYHYAFPHLISQIADILKFRFAFLDGKTGLDRNGPMVGVPVNVGWLVSSDSLGAFDMTVSGMMGWDWRKIEHLQMARKNGYAPSPDEIEVMGPLDQLRRVFTLHRSFWSYPALVAFHSRRLTRFVYLSVFSKFLHDVMYTFRKRPISP